MILTLLTGPEGGLWKPLGEEFGRVLEGQLGVQVRVTSGAGIANLLALAEGRAEMAFANVISSRAALAGRPPFAAPVQNVAHLGTLSFQYLQVLLRCNSGIAGVADLRGKRLAVEPPGSTVEELTRRLLEMHGLEYGDLAAVQHGSFLHAARLLKAGEADAFALINPVPAPIVTDLVTARVGRPLVLSAEAVVGLQRQFDGLCVRPLPPHAGLPAAPGVGNFTHLLVRQELPRGFVYNVAAALIRHLPILAAVSADLEQFTVADLARPVGVPLHPGAMSCYADLRSMPAATSLRDRSRPTNEE